MALLEPRQGVVRELLDPLAVEPRVEVDEQGTISALADHELGDNVVLGIQAVDEADALDVGDDSLWAVARGHALGDGRDRVTLLDASPVVVAHHDEVALVGAVVEARALEGFDAEVEEDAIGVDAEDVGVPVGILAVGVGGWGRGHDGDPRRLRERDGEVSSTVLRGRLVIMTTSRRLRVGGLELRYPLRFRLRVGGLELRYPLRFRLRVGGLDLRRPVRFRLRVGGLGLRHPVRFRLRLTLSTRWWGVAGGEEGDTEHTAHQHPCPRHGFASVRGFVRRREREREREIERERVRRWCGFGGGLDDLGEMKERMVLL